MDSIQNFRGLFGEQNFENSNNAIHLESLIDRSAIYNFEITEHVHTNLVQVFFIEKGNTTLYSEGSSVYVQAPCVIYVPEGSLHGFSFSKTIVGEVLTLKAELLADALEGLMDMSLYFQQLRYIPFDQNRSSFHELMGTRQRLRAELTTRKIARDKIITLLIQILLVRLYRLIIEHSELELPQNKRKLAHFNAFIKQVKKDYGTTIKVSDYASKLHMSPVHLNRICKELVQKSALQVIHEQLTHLAKRSLLKENKSIAEIGYELNFKDPSHFSKFFKKQVGKSPKQFKRHFRSN